MTHTENCRHLLLHSAVPYLRKFMHDRAIELPGTYNLHRRIQVTATTTRNVEKSIGCNYEGWVVHTVLH